MTTLSNIYNSRNSNGFLDEVGVHITGQIYTSRDSNEFLDSRSLSSRLESTQVEILMSFWTVAMIYHIPPSTQVEILMSFWTVEALDTLHPIYTSRDSNEFLDLHQVEEKLNIYTSRNSNEFLDIISIRTILQSTQVEILMSFWTGSVAFVNSLSTQVEILMSFWTEDIKRQTQRIYTSRDSNEFLDSNPA